MATIKSPLNYSGGKAKLLPQLKKLFPDNYTCFIDLFCGGGTVGINETCDNVILNDINKTVISLFDILKKYKTDTVFEEINRIITRFGLSQSSEYGYDKYKCKSSEGLGSYNKNRFIELRNYFNSLDVSSVGKLHYHLIFYTLIVYSFNNQIRFSKSGEYNLPVGKRDFNTNMQKKLRVFADTIKENRFQLKCGSFSDINLSQFDSNTFIYADPPYLITCATYNERDGWNTEKEIELLNYLDRANQAKIRFALSNVLSSKGKTNEILKEWTERNSYTVHHLSFDYSNSNYHRKNPDLPSDEVLICNY